MSATDQEAWLPANGTEFEAFYAAYPRKVSRGAARKAWSKAVTKVDPAVIMAAVALARPGWAMNDIKFVPHPASWLNREQWADEINPPAGQPAPGSFTPDDPQCPDCRTRWHHGAPERHAAWCTTAKESA